jgi:hypothetical protein
MNIQQNIFRVVGIKIKKFCLYLNKVKRTLKISNISPMTNNNAPLKQNLLFLVA